jgi:hypothetical protein
MLGLGRNLVQPVRLVVSFRLHYFSAPSDHFYQKNYLKFSLEFPAGHMQLYFDTLPDCVFSAGSTNRADL